MTATYIVGTELELEATFVDQDGDPANPSTVQVFIRLPDQTEEELSPVTNPTVGTFRVAFTPTQNGLHEYRFQGEGALVVAGESYFMAQTVFPAES